MAYPTGGRRGLIHLTWRGTGEHWKLEVAGSFVKCGAEIGFVMPTPDLKLHIPKGARIILVRHGRPALPLRPRTGHHGFRAYIDAYESAGLDPDSLPPRELADLVKELDHVFSSGRPRAHQSAQALAPKAEVTADPLFVEAPLASPRIPLLKMRVPKWAIVARVLWHAGYHPEIENYRKAKHRAGQAADILINKVRESGKREKPGAAVLVAHGYFNAMIGRILRQRGFTRTGAHRARYWNAVIYKWEHT